MSGILYIGNKGSDIQSLAYNKAAEILGIGTDLVPSHPDFLFVGLDGKAKSIGVDMAAMVVEKAVLKPSISERTVCIIDSMDKMTVEAQNKLLKTLEESPMLIIGICYEDTLLPTVRSRCQIVRLGDNNTYPDDVKNIFDDVERVLDGNDYSGLFKVLNLVKEKDTSSFFALHREYVGDLVTVIGKKLVALNKINEKLSKVLADSRARSLTTSYTKDDFFVMIAIVSLIGG